MTPLCRPNRTDAWITGGKRPVSLLSCAVTQNPPVTTATPTSADVVNPSGRVPSDIWFYTWTIALVNCPTDVPRAGDHIRGITLRPNQHR
jgi:hypothetical protein